MTSFILAPSPSHGAKVDTTIAGDKEFLAHAASDDVFGGAGAAKLGGQAGSGRPKRRKR